MFRLKKYRLIAASLIFIIMGSVTLMAEENNIARSGPDEPAETEIILPEMYLEIEDLSIEEIDAVIPDNDSVLLSALELPLPELAEIEIPAEVFAVSELGAPFEISSGAESTGSAFYSEAVIGLGTSANITGDINLYRIGEQPDFRLRYFHDSYDGFGGAQTGEGYSTREELIEAELNYLDDNLSADVLTSYNEIETGLQGRTDYFSLTRRIPEVNADIEWLLLDKLRLTGVVDASLAGFQLNSLSPLGYSLLSFSPSIGLVYGDESFNAGLTVSYSISGEAESGLNQGLGANLTLKAEPSEMLRLSGDVGILWDNYSEFLFPFQLGIEGTGSVFDYSLTGGWSAEYQDRTDLWDIFPTAAGPGRTADLGSIALTTGWSVDGKISWNVSEFVSLRADADFSLLDNALMPAGSSLTGFNSLVAVDSTCFELGLGAYLKITDNFTFDLGWSGQLLEDLDWFSPRHIIATEAELTSNDRNMGIIGTVDFQIFDEDQTWFENEWLPLIGLEAYLRLSDGFVLSVSGEDLASGLLESGRNAWNGYLDKGAVLQAKIKISL